MKIVINNKQETLTQRNYVSSGGEGQVYQKGGTAYKIMHKDKQPIPQGKVKELLAIKNTNVLIPQAPIFDVKKKYIGYTMPFIHKTEFLCKLFSRSYRDQHNISPQNITISSPQQKPLSEGTTQKPFRPNASV